MCKSANAGCAGPRENNKEGWAGRRPTEEGGQGEPAHEKPPTRRRWAGQARRARVDEHRAHAIGRGKKRVGRAGQDGSGALRLARMTQGAGRLGASRRRRAAARADLRSSGPAGPTRPASARCAPAARLLSCRRDRVGRTQGAGRLGASCRRRAAAHPSVRSNLSCAARDRPSRAAPARSALARSAPAGTETGRRATRSELSPAPPCAVTSVAQLGTDPAGQLQHVRHSHDPRPRGRRQGAGRLGASCRPPLRAQ